MEMQYGHKFTIMLFMNTFCKPNLILTEKKQRCIDTQVLDATRKLKNSVKISQLSPTKPAALIL